MAHKAILFDSYSFMTCLRTYIHKLVYLLLLHILYFTTLRYFGANDRLAEGGSGYIGYYANIFSPIISWTVSNLRLYIIFFSSRFSYNIVCDSVVGVRLSNIWTLFKLNSKIIWSAAITVCVTILKWRNYSCILNVCFLLNVFIYFAEVVLVLA